MNKCVVYGVGQYFLNNINFIDENYDVIGYFDQNNDISIYPRVNVLDYVESDVLFVIATEKYEAEICAILINKYNINSKRILLLHDEIIRHALKSQTGFRSWSQYGEDYVVYTILSKRGLLKERFIYLEVGAYDPIRANNTYFLELMGRGGVIVEADYRSVDINKVVKREASVWNYLVVPEKTPQRDAVFYISDNPGFSSAKQDNIIMNGGHVVDVKKVKTITLDNIFDSISERIEFVTLDIEGLDRAVIMGTHWEKYRPTVVCAEIGCPDKEIVKYMDECGYLVAYTNGINTIFELK